MVRCVSDGLKTKKIYKNPVKKLPFVTRYVLIDIRSKKCVIKLF